MADEQAARPALNSCRGFLTLRRAWILRTTMITIAVAGCGTFADVPDDVHTGLVARDRILKDGRVALDTRKKGALPESSTAFYFFEGGSFNGIILYWSFECATLDDCWSAIVSLGGPDQSEFNDWKTSQFAIVMNGPGFYSHELETPLWDVRTISNGASYERVEDENRRMVYFAIDFDTLRVYHHYESGGFPTEKYAIEQSPRK